MSDKAPTLEDLRTKAADAFSDLSMAAQMVSLNLRIGGKIDLAPVIEQYGHARYAFTQIAVLLTKQANPQ